MRFKLSRGYLSKTTLREKKDEDMDDEVISGFLSQLLLERDKIECYHTCLPSGYTDAEMVFDYLILYKTDEGFKPIVIKNGAHQWSRPSKWFERYYKKFANEYFDGACHTLNGNQLLDLVCESSREKFHEFLKEKYSDFIRQEILMF